MTQAFRLASGGTIDRSRPLRFTFDGREYTGYAGDTLASALLANGVRITGRSFKYHRARGIYGAGYEEPNTLVQLGSGARTEPNLKATQVQLADGLEARAVNCWPSARFDVLAPLRWFKAFMPSGFYYKTFMLPGWHWFEGIIRAAAGLGRSPREADPDRYDKRFESVDVLVVGGGTSGVEAAQRAAASGKQVLLVDDQPQVQGIAASSNLRLRTRCTVFGYYDHDYLLAIEQLAPGPVRQRLWHIRARQVILATGAIERPLVFPHNDRPGVMLASAAHQYFSRYAVLPGRRLVIATNNDSAYATALELLIAGAQIVAVLDARGSSVSPEAQALAAR
ncbi:MAG TPA: 2Fe-2S iron-sulfur cluster-binding protein, partial [Nevskiaceae bacterium]|nr:2Fe-2S iron-sulfur cluster-binding protein [Nevskiaceae bacterium]